MSKTLVLSKHAFVYAVVTAFFATSLLLAVMPAPARAASLNETQIQAIVSLLSSFGADASVIANVNATLHGQSTSGSGSTTVTQPACISLSYDMYSGSTDSTTNGQVSQLQQFLGVNPTGFFGPVTEQAVQNWQSSHGVVSSGSPDTNGYGFVGTRTRVALGCGGSSQTYTPPTTTNTNPSATIDSSSLTTSSGVPTITGSASGGSSVYITVTAGTNQAGTANQAGNGQASVVNGRWSVTIYPKAESAFTAGVYSVSVYTALGGTLLTTGTLSILGNALQPSATIDHSSLTQTTGTNVVVTGESSNASNGLIVYLAVPQVGCSDYLCVSGQFGKDGIYLGTGGEKDSGQWSESFGTFASPGTYYVFVYDANSKALLTTGTLTVTGNASVSCPDGYVVSDKGCTLAPPNSTLTATPSTITAGQPVAIAYQVSNANYCVASGGWSGTYSAPSGHYSGWAGDKGPFYPTQTTTYSFICYSSNGSSQTQNVTVAVNSSQSTTFTATPTSGAAPLAVQFGIKGLNLSGTPTSYSLNFGDNSIPLTIPATMVGADVELHTYTSAGTYSAQLVKNCTPPSNGSIGCAAPQVLGTATITVNSSTIPTQTNPVSINSFTVSPSTVNAGQPVTFSWSSNLTSNDISQNGGGCYIQSPTNPYSDLNAVGNSTNYGPSGSFTYAPTATATYTLDCLSGGKDGAPSATRQVTVSVNGTAAVTVSTDRWAPTANITASPSSITPGQSAIITWSSTNAMYCAGAAGFYPGGRTSGSMSVTPTKTTTYAINCPGTSGPSATASTTLTVGQVLGAETTQLTEPQIQAVLNLLSSFNVAQSTVNTVNAVLHGQSTGGSSNNENANASGNNSTCLSLSYNLFEGLSDSTTGGEVTQLQHFLGLSTTGYFGPMTRKALQGWQAAHGVVSSGSPSTTGFGFVGMHTRSAMGCAPQSTSTTNQSQTGQTNTISFAATPASGPAPLTATFIVTNSDTRATYTINFGDGQTGLFCQINSYGISPCGTTWTGQHIYNTVGTYVAKLIAQPPFVCSGPAGTVCAQVMPAPQTVGTATITVGSTSPITNVTPPAPTCTLTASKASVQPGEAVTLTWSSTNALYASSPNGPVMPNGSVTVTPTTDTVYQKTVYGEGNATCQAEVLVIKPQATASTTEATSTATSTPAVPVNTQMVLIQADLNVASVVASVAQLPFALAINSLSDIFVQLGIVR